LIGSYVPESRPTHDSVNKIFLAELVRWQGFTTVERLKTRSVGGKSA
jgi:hypothetical protein